MARDTRTKEMVMIQFLRYDKNRVQDAVFTLITGRQLFLFFARCFLYLLLFVYSTVFLAVAIPFFHTPCIPIYFIGAMATAFLFVRVLNHALKYMLYRGTVLTISEKALEIKNDREWLKIPFFDITYIEVNVLGNVVIRQKESRKALPFMLFSETDRDRLLSLFEDMAPKRTARYRKIWEVVDAIVVALVLAVHIIQYVVQAYFIPTGSMEDTLLVGDHLFVEKVTYGPIIPQMIGMSKPLHLSGMSVRDIRRGDIVIFRPPHEKDKDYIKRCIAMPGDNLDFRDGDVYLNDQKLVEPFVKGRTYDDFSRSRVKGVVPAGKIVVLGDNRENSSDSRVWGYLDIERIKGRAFILYWNTDNILKGDFSRLGLIR